MEKKPGQISSNTLNLRFMQNAARANEEREAEAARAKIRTEEEWELAPHLRERWAVESRTDGQRRVSGNCVYSIFIMKLDSVSYEQSYLPFLYPASSNDASASATAAQEDGEVNEKPVIRPKGRMTFGKHVKAEAEEPESAPPPSKSNSDDILTLRGARSISSHGRAATSSKSSGRPPQRPALEASTLTSSLIGPPMRAPMQPPAHGFIKPQVDAPQSREEIGIRKKRSSVDEYEDRTSKPISGGWIDGARKRKKRLNEDT
ncbi:hypothetical protein K439DRAFT_1611763 [Ramaria rubella]|nr:hypothetical protein K439DRAFT_1611763 [Ramaria rubella]